MDSLNTILNSGTYGENVSRHNDNNSKIKQAITTLENVAIANKGYFDTLASLQAAFPSPKAGNIAYVANVASSTGYYIYNVVSGVWTATTTEAPAVGVEISNYAQHGYSSSPKTLKQVDDEVIQLAGGSTKTLKNVEDEIVQLAGEVSVKMTNLIANGDFRNGLTNWSSNGLSLVLDNGKLIASNWTDSFSRLRVNYSQRPAIGDKLYLLVEDYERSDINSGANLIRARINDTGTDFFSISGSPDLFFPKLSGITEYAGQEALRIDIRTYQGVGNTVSIGKTRLINLTATFGAGSEPTKEEFELLLSILGDEYFEGEITIPDQKLMQWQQVKSLNEMFMRAGFQIKDVTSYNEYGIPNEYNCVWEDGTEGHVVLSNFDENVFEYRRKKAYYRDIEVDYGDVIYDENGYILSQSPTLIN